MPDQVSLAQKNTNAVPAYLVLGSIQFRLHNANRVDIAHFDSIYRGLAHMTVGE
jgi:hypothetical protein